MFKRRKLQVKGSQLKRSLLGMAIALVAGQAQAAGLMELYKETLESDPRLAVAAAEVTASDAQSRQALANLLPQVSMTAQLTENKRHPMNGDNTYNGEKYVLSLSQSVYDRSRWANKERYEHLAEQRVMEYEDTRAGTALDLLQRYTDVLAAQDNLELIEAEQEATSQQLAQLRSRYRRQLAVLTDVLDVEARLDGIKAQLIVAQNDVSIAREALAELVGREVNESLNGFTRRIAYAEDGRDLNNWVQLAVKNSPALMALAAEIDAGRAYVRETRAGHLPTLDAGLTAQKSDIGFENSSSSRSETYVASLTLSVPLYSGGRTSAAVDEAHARLVVSQKRLEERQRQLLKQVREAYLNTESSWARIAAAEKAVMSASKSYEAMQKGFEFGTVTVVDVLDALRDEYSYRRDYRQAQYDFAVSRLSLLKSAGVLTQDDVRQVDSWLGRVD
ncbi:MAG: TolC family outer membrane protein [Marinobacterium sp.]|nr:TolC family outer membrane protein [Marinobacterium sp.]